MNSNTHTMHHTHQLIIYVLIFIIVLVATAWMYNVQVREAMERTEHTPTATKEEMEAVYGAPVDLSVEEKASLEAIYGN